MLCLVHVKYNENVRKYVNNCKHWGYIYHIMIFE